MRRGVVPVVLLLAAAVIAGGVLLHLRSGGSRAEFAPPPSQPPPPSPAEATATAESVKEGLRFSFELEALGDGSSRASLRIADARTGEPIRGLRPLAWLARATGDARDEKGCRERIGGYLGGLLSSRPEVSLSGFLLLALNTDATVSVIDPNVALSRTKLLSLPSLPGEAGGWALAGETVFVSIPGRNLVSAVSPIRGRVELNLPVPARPRAVVASADEKWIWVGTGGERVHLLDARARREVAALEAGPGPHLLAQGSDPALIWAHSPKSGTLSLFDAASRERLRRVETGPGFELLAVSPPAQVAWLGAPRSGSLIAVATEDGRILHRVQLAPGATSMAIDPSGRFVFVAHRERGTVTVLEGATGRQLEVIRNLAAPDHLAFTERFAYVHLAGKPALALIPLGVLGTGRTVAVSTVAMGQTLPGDFGEVGPPLAVSPEGDALMVAHGPDRSLYYYREGMMAPMGTHQSYGRAPRAVLLLDRSLREDAPGEYVATLRVPGAGEYELAYLLDSPRVGGCMTVAIAGGGPSEPKPPALSVVPLFDEDAALRAGETTSLEVWLGDSRGGAAVSPEEIEALVFQPPGIWHDRPRPVPTGRGTFTVSFKPPDRGQLRLSFAVPSRNLEHGSIPALRLRVTPPPTEDTPR